MGMQTSNILLDAQGIDESSEALWDFLVGAELDRRSALSARLTFESALLRLRERFGDGTPAELVMGSRFGRPVVMARVKGERFDPREVGDETPWERSLMEASGMRPVYAYRGGINIVSISGPLRISSMAQSAAAITLGVVLGFSGRFMPDDLRLYILDGLVSPLFDTYIGMLSGIAGPMVFLSVAWGICGIGDMVALGRSGKALIGRFLRADVLAVLFAMGVCLPIFRLQGGLEAQGAGLLASVTGMLLDLLPTNIVQPFLEGNTLQIIVLSMAVGVAALSLGDATEGLRQALYQLNLLVQFLMEQLCRLLPGFIVVMMVSQSWAGTTASLLECWLPIVVASVLIVAYLLIQVVVASVRRKIALPALASTLLPSLMVSFTTASASAAFGTIRSTCEDELGIDDDQVSFGVPLGMVLCKPAVAILLVVVMFYSARAFGVGGDLVWYVRLGVSCLLYAVAVPPVPGGMLACYGMLLGGLGIPLEALGVVTALDFLLDNLSCSGGVGALILEVLSAADSLGALGGSAQK